MKHGLKAVVGADVATAATRQADAGVERFQRFAVKAFLLKRLGEIHVRPGEVRIFLTLQQPCIGQLHT